MRIANIPKELEQRAQDGVRLEKDLLATRSAATQPEPLALLRAELLDWQLQLQRAQTEALQAERDWLIKRVPLQDALLKVAQTRLRNLQQDLDTIKQALDQTIQQEQATLSHTAATMAQQREQTLDPAEALVLEIGLETVETRRMTAEYRQQLNDLTDEILAQEKQNARLKQNIDRLAALVDRGQLAKL